MTNPTNRNLFQDQCTSEKQKRAPFDAALSSEVSFANDKKRRRTRAGADSDDGSYREAAVRPCDRQVRDGGSCPRGA